MNYVVWNRAEMLSVLLEQFEFLLVKSYNLCLAGVEMHFIFARAFLVVQGRNILIFVLSTVRLCV